MNDFADTSSLQWLSMLIMNDNDYKVGGNDDDNYDGDDGNDGGDDGDNDGDDGNVHRRSGQTAAHTLSSVRARINTFSSTSRLR